MDASNVVAEVLDALLHSALVVVRRDRELGVHEPLLSTHSFHHSSL